MLGMFKEFTTPDYGDEPIKITININHIAMALPDGDGGTTIQLMNDGVITVLETYEEVRAICS
jgi:hypothetical protein